MSGGMTGGMMDGFLWSAVFMASMPYILLAVIGGGLYLAFRRERERAVEDALAEQRDWEDERSADALRGAGR